LGTPLGAVLSNVAVLECRDKGTLGFGIIEMREYWDKGSLGFELNVACSGHQVLWIMRGSKGNAFAV